MAFSCLEGAEVSEADQVAFSELCFYCLQDGIEDPFGFSFGVAVFPGDCID